MYTWNICKKTKTTRSADQLVEDWKLGTIVKQKSWVVMDANILQLGSSTGSSMGKQKGL